MGDTSAQQTSLAITAPQILTHICMPFQNTESKHQQTADHRLNPASICFNKIVLAHNHAHLFIGCIWLVLCYSAELSDCSRCVTQEAGTVHSVTPQKKRAIMKPLHYLQ